MSKSLTAAWGLLLLLASMAPAQDMPLKALLIPGEDWELMAQGYELAEGPAVDAEGNVYFTDIPGSKIYKIEAPLKVSVFVEDSRHTNGLMFGPDGRLYGCQNGAERIVAFDRSGQPHTIAAGVHSNDLVVAKNGGIYFTDPSNQQVWYINPLGEKRVVDQGVTFPNGVILWPDQATLVVADMRGDRLWAYSIQSDGGLTNKQPIYMPQMTPGKVGSGADGMTVDTAGRLYLASYAGLQVFDTQCRLSGIIAKPQPKFLSNVVLAGPKLDTLYVTSTDGVYRRKVNATGLRYFEPTK